MVRARPLFAIPSWNGGLVGGREAQGLEATPGVLRCHGAVRRLCDLLCRLDRGRKNTRGVPFITGVRGYARVRMHTPAPVRTGARPARRVPMRVYARTHPTPCNFFTLS